MCSTVIGELDLPVSDCVLLIPEVEKNAWLITLTFKLMTNLQLSCAGRRYRSLLHVLPYIM